MSCSPPWLCLQSSSKSMLPPPTSLLSSKLRAPGVSPGHHSFHAAPCAQKRGLQRNSLPWERIAAAAAEMQTKALVQGQFQHQDRQDFRRGIGTYCKRKHNAQKRNPQPYIKLQPTSPALPPSGAENSSPLHQDCMKWEPGIAPSK